MEWYPALSCPSFQQLLGQGLGRRRLLQELPWGGWQGKCKLTSSVPPKARPEPRAPVCVESADPWRCRPLLVSPRHLCFQACWRPKHPTRSSLGTGCLEHSLPCTSPDARQSGRSEESCQVKGRNTQRPRSWAPPLRPQGGFPAAEPGGPCAVTPQPGAPRGSGAPGCLVGGVPAKESPYRGKEGPRRGALFGATACRGEENGGGGQGWN